MARVVYWSLFYWFIIIITSYAPIFLRIKAQWCHKIKGLSNLIVLNNAQVIICKCFY